MTLSHFATIHNLNQNLCDSISLRQSSKSFPSLSSPKFKKCCLARPVPKSATLSLLNSTHLNSLRLSNSRNAAKTHSLPSLRLDVTSPYTIESPASLSQLQEMLLIWPGSLLTANLPIPWPPNTPHTRSKFPNSHNTHRPHRTTILVTSHKSVSPATQKFTLSPAHPKTLAANLTGLQNSKTQNPKSLCGIEFPCPRFATAPAAAD